MRVLILALMLITICLQEEKHAIREELRQSIKSFETLKIEDNQFAQKSMSQIREMMGTRPPSMGEIMKTQLLFDRHGIDLHTVLNDDTEIPDNFDTRQLHPNCTVEVKNQGQCGSCWAFGSATTLSYNNCVQSGKSSMPSVQELLNCVKSDQGQYFGCNGGYMRNALEYAHYTGVGSYECTPYKGYRDQCDRRCTVEGQQYNEIYCDKVVGRLGRSPQVYIQRALMKYGALTTGFLVYEDLMHYKSGVYRHEKGSQVGGHAITVVGWGKQGNTDYWIVQNSWGSWWGQNGFFYMDMDDYDCEFFTMFGYLGCAAYSEKRIKIE